MGLFGFAWFWVVLRFSGGFLVSLLMVCSNCLFWLMFKFSCAFVICLVICWVF